MKTKISLWLNVLAHLAGLLCVLWYAGLASHGTYLALVHSDWYYVFSLGILTLIYFFFSLILVESFREIVGKMRATKPA